MHFIIFKLPNILIFKYIDTFAFAMGFSIKPISLIVLFSLSMIDSESIDSFLVHFALINISVLELQSYFGVSTIFIVG